MSTNNDVFSCRKQQTTSATAKILLPNTFFRFVRDTAKTVTSHFAFKWRTRARWTPFYSDTSSEITDQINFSGDIAIPPDYGFSTVSDGLISKLIDKAQLTRGCRVLSVGCGGKLSVTAISNEGVGYIESFPDASPSHHALEDAMFGAGHFLSILPERSFDKAIINPPLANSADIRHVFHALKWIKPGGTLVAVMAKGVLHENTQLAIQFREMFVAANGQVEPNYEENATAAGAAFKTITVVIPIERNHGKH